MTGLAAMNMVGLDFASEWKTVSADDYDSSADSYPVLYSVDIQAQLVSADVYEATYTVNVIVEDSEGNAISGANVELDGKSGGYFPDGTYTISASADGYDTLSQDITIDGAHKTVTVTLFESTYSVDVLVEDSEGNAISGATVEIEGTDGAIQYPTDGAIQYLTDGQYNITASADGYDTLSQDITVDGAAETVTVTLSEEEEAVIVSESSSEESGGMSTLVSASVVAFFGIFIMVVFLFGKD
jgi:flagellar hook assembly protein FlgD